MKGKLSNTDNHMNTLGYSNEEFNRIVSDQSEPDDGELKKVALEQSEFDDEQTSTRKKEIKKKSPFRKVIAAVLATATVAGAGIGIKGYNDYEKFVNDPVNKIKATDEYKQFESQHGVEYSDPVATFNAVENDKSGSIAHMVLSNDEAKSYNYDQRNEKVNGGRFGFKPLMDKVKSGYNTNDAISLFNGEIAPILDNYLNAIDKNPDYVKIVDKEFGEYYGGDQLTDENKRFRDYASNLMDSLKDIVSGYGPNSDFEIQKAVSDNNLPDNSFGQKNENCNSSICHYAYCTTDKDGSSQHIDQFDQIVVKIDTYKDDGSYDTTYKKIGKIDMMFHNADQNSENEGGTPNCWSMGANK